MTNQHPGPIDPGRLGFGGTGMYGRRVHCARLIFARTVEGHLFTEATIQRVAPEYDEGMILASTIVPIEETDAVDDLQARVLPVEHKVSVEVILDYINGTVRERPRQVPLVDPEDHALLGRAKEIAIKLYPKG